MKEAMVYAINPTVCYNSKLDTQKDYFRRLLIGTDYQLTFVLELVYQYNIIWGARNVLLSHDPRPLPI